MKKFLTFRTMIAPGIIQIAFWVGVVVCVVGGVAILAQGAEANNSEQVLGGIALIIFGPLVVRLYCELGIIFFRIHDALVAIQEQTAPPKVEQF